MSFQTPANKSEAPNRPLLRPSPGVRQELMLVGGGLVLLLAVIATVLAVIAFGQSSSGTATATQAPPPPAAGEGTVLAAAPSIDEAEGVEFDEFTRVDPNLPPVPEGDVKSFEVDVYHHITQVDPNLAPTEVWSYEVNGVAHRGTGYSETMVVEEGDVVDFKLTNGSSEEMNVTLPHSVDFHSAKVNPAEAYADLMPGESMRYRFVAEHPGVYMYHCATAPVLQHTGAGMMGAMVVKPKGLSPARDLIMVQQEYYIGEPGGLTDMTKLEAKQPDVIAFNGYANQYADDPVIVEANEPIRIWILNAGPSIWTAFHVIGTVFDRTVVEGVEGASAQTVNLAPSQGAILEFTLDEEGTYPFVTHAFGDMVKGALGVLQTSNAPETHGDGAH